MANNISSITIGGMLKQSGYGLPTHIAPNGSEFTDLDDGSMYVNEDGVNTWVLKIYLNNDDDGTNGDCDEPITIKNSDNSYNLVIPNTNEIVLDDEIIQVDDINDNVLETLINPTYKDITVDIDTFPITVKNSDNTYHESVGIDETHDLPDITHTDSDGSSVTLPAQTPVTCSPPVIDEWTDLIIDTTIVTGNSSNTEFKIKASNTFLTVDLGDGSDIIYMGKTGNGQFITFNYATAGVYNFRLKGNGDITFQGTNADGKKITEVKNFGSNLFLGINTFKDCRNAVFTATDKINLENGSNAFYNCYLLEKLKEPTNIEFGNIAYWFRNSVLNDNLGGWDIRAVNNLTEFALNVTTWSTENYGNTLMGWLRWDSTTHAPAVGWVLQSNQNFHGGNSTLVTGSEAVLARDYLINTLGWVITDGGLV